MSFLFCLTIFCTNLKTELKIPTNPDILGIAISNRSLDSHESCVDNHSGTLDCVIQNSKEKIVTFLTNFQRQNEHVHRNS